MTRLFISREKKIVVGEEKNNYASLGSIAARAATQQEVIHFLGGPASLFDGHQAIRIRSSKSRQFNDNELSSTKMMKKYRRQRTFIM